MTFPVSYGLEARQSVQPTLKTKGLLKGVKYQERGILVGERSWKTFCHTPVLVRGEISSWKIMWLEIAGSNSPKEYWGVFTRRRKNGFHTHKEQRPLQNS